MNFLSSQGNKNLPVILSLLFIIYRSSVLFCIETELDTLKGNVNNDKFMSNAYQSEFHTEKSKNFACTKVSWVRFFTFASIIPCLNAEWVQGKWEADRAVIENFWTPPDRVNDSWSGQYSCGDILSTHGCFASSETDTLVSWISYKDGENAIEVYNPDSPRVSEQQKPFFPARWLDIGAVRCSSPKAECCDDSTISCSSICYRLEHQLAIIRGYEYYTGRYRDTDEILDCLAHNKIVKIDNVPQCLDTKLAQSVKIISDYSCANGLQFAEDVTCLNCLLSFDHAGFEPKNSSHFLQVVERTMCDYNIIDQKVRLEECSSFPIYRSPMSPVYNLLDKYVHLENTFTHKPARIAYDFLAKILDLEKITLSSPDSTNSIYDLSYFAYIVPDGALKKESFKRTLRFGHFIIKQNNKLITQDSMLLLGGTVIFFRNFPLANMALMLPNNNDHPHQD